MKTNNQPATWRTFRALLLCAAIGSSLGCESVGNWWNPTSGYEPVGNPQLHFDEAKAICEREAEFRSSGGTSQVDWGKFERCMKPKGWVRGAQS
jgi:hypothetical protein